MTAKTIYLHALTPVHSGTGQTAAIIDLPIAREKTTGWPVLPASSLKGVLREAFTQRDPQGNISNQSIVNELFGRQEEAGAFCFGDQRLLCLPVRSYYGTFAYLSCPLALQRLRRDMTAFGITPPFPEPPEVTDTDTALTIQVTAGSALAREQKVYLEDLDLAAQINGTVADIAVPLGNLLFPTSLDAFKSRFALVSDAVFDFLCETATEVAARISLNENKTTTGGGGNLWYEEAVPAEAIFCGFGLMQIYGKGEARAQRLQQAADALTRHNGATIQIGGNSSVGRGLCRVVVA